MDNFKYYLSVALLVLSLIAFFIVSLFHNVDAQLILLCFIVVSSIFHFVQLNKLIR